MSVNVPLHKWRSADPAILIGRRCIAQTDQDVIIDGRLELIRHPDGTASLRFKGIRGPANPDGTPKKPTTILAGKREP